jgi:hypothetical protein
MPTELLDNSVFGKIKKKLIFFYFKLIFFFVFLDYFDVFILKIILKK